MKLVIYLIYEGWDNIIINLYLNKYFYFLNIFDIF